MELWVENSLKNIKPKTESNDKDLTTDLNPKIFFGIFNQSSISGKVQDNETFLSYSDFKALYRQYKDYPNKEYDKLISPQFKNALNNAHKRIWLIDGYLSTPNYRFKFEELIVLLSRRMCYLDDVRIFFDKDKNQSDIQELLDLYNEELISKRLPEIKCKFFTNYPIHDRFAIIDDVLWHFGSDVGSTNKSIHATSYGWNAVSLKAVKFFEEFWSTGYEK